MYTQCIKIISNKQEVGKLSFEFKNILTFTTK